ncbi:MAG: glycosyltransferase family 4 protein [Acidimicrobiales bacterium]
MTRLLAVVNQFPAPSETFIQRKLLGLRAAGFDVSVAAPELGAGVADLGLGAVPLAPWRHPRQALGGAGARSVLASTLAAGRPSRSGAGARRRALVAPIAAAGADIVHFEFSGIAVSYRDVLAELAPAKLAVSCRGAAEQIQPLLDPSRGPALAEVFERVDLVHCVSDDMARTVQALGADPARIVVNRPAVPVADFAGLREGRLDHDGPLRVASVGRLHWKKGFDDGLVAVAALHHGGRPVEYRIAGEGGERAKLAFLVHHHGLDGVVHLLGSRPQPEVRELLAWADVLLLPSLSEGISNAVLEAMAAGLPVVATRAGGMDEAIVDGSEGLLVDVGDAAAMAGALDALAADPDRRRALGAAAAARAAADFDLSRQIATFEDAYRRLLAA